MRKVVGRESMKAAPAIAATISNPAAISKNGELCRRFAGAGFAFELSDAVMLQPSGV